MGSGVSTGPLLAKTKTSAPPAPVSVWCSPSPAKIVCRPAPRRSRYYRRRCRSPVAPRTGRPRAVREVPLGRHEGIGLHVRRAGVAADDIGQRRRGDHLAGPRIEAGFCQKKRSPIRSSNCRAMIAWNVGPTSDPADGPQQTTNEQINVVDRLVSLLQDWLARSGPK